MVSEVRRCGFMVGIEIGGYPLEAQIGHRVTLEARSRGAIVRPLGDVVVLMPPLAISEQDLERLVVIVWESIVAATSERELAAA
jgi:adenosylmethionine-8-amino-7-oxononanoate aminotransferase